jgi:hypothetical protein
MRMEVAQFDRPAGKRGVEDVIGQLGVDGLSFGGLQRRFERGLDGFLHLVGLGSDQRPLFGAKLAHAFQDFGEAAFFAEELGLELEQGGFAPD